MVGKFLGAARAIGVRAAVTFVTQRAALLTAGDIVSLVLSEGVDSGVMIGDALSAACSMVVDLSGAGDADYVGARVKIELSEAGEWSDLGEFFVEEFHRADNSPVATLVMRDSMYSRGALPFVDGLTYPATLAQIWAHAAAQASYSFSGNVPCGECVIDMQPDWGEISVRQALSYISAAAGCFARVNRAGKLEIVRLLPTEAAYSIGAHAHFSREVAGREFGPVNGVDITTRNALGDNDSTPALLSVTVDNGGARCPLTVKNNPLFLTGAPNLNALAAATLSMVNGLKYAGCAFEYRGDPALMPGARVAIGGGEFLLSRQTFTLAGGFSAECACGCPEMGAIAARVISPDGGVDAGRITGVISGGNIAANAISAIKIATGAVTADKIGVAAITAEKLATGAVEAESIAAGAISADKIASGAITADKIAAEAVSAEKIAANAVTARAISTNAVTADKCVAGLIAADSALIAVGAIRTAQIADASVTAAKIVSIDADTITAGTLSAERLLLVGEGGVVYRINAAASGLSAAELTDDEYKNHIDGSVLVADSVTAAQIAAGAITANEIAANSINAENINIADLFASTGTINAIRTMTVSSVIAGSSIEISEQAFRVRAPVTEIALPGAEDGAEIATMDENGLYADVIVSPSIVSTHRGGEFVVGANGDFEMLDDAFEAISERALKGDITLILARESDPGGALRGVSGGRVVTIIGANLFAPLDPTARLTGVTASSQGDGVRLTLVDGGVQGFARYDIGAVGMLGAAGRRIYISHAHTAGGGVGVKLMRANMDEVISETNIADGYFDVPVNTADDCHIVAELSVAGVTYADFEIYMGYSANAPAVACAPRVAELSIDGCDCMVHIAHISLMSGVSVRRGDLTLARCNMSGALNADFARALMYDCVGECETAVAARASQVYVDGWTPDGARVGGEIYIGNIACAGDSPAPEITVGSAICPALATGTYSEYWWSGDRSVRQGRTRAHDALLGGMWFDMSPIPGGAVITGISLSIKRMSGFGGSSRVAIKAYGTASAARSGRPALTSSAFELGNIDMGATRAFPLPPQLMSGLASGQYAGIALKADDAALLTGKTYSRNFCRICGTDSADAPKLYVDYTIGA